MSKKCMLTTFDNPFDPFDKFDDWARFDESKGYYSCSRLARIAKVSEDLTQKEIDEEIENIIRSAYGRTESILTEHMDKLHIIAQKLFENEKMTGEEFASIMSETVIEESIEE